MFYPFLCWLVLEKNNIPVWVEVGDLGVFKRGGSCVRSSQTFGTSPGSSKFGSFLLRKLWVEKTSTSCFKP